VLGFLQQVFSGLALGSLYAIVAIGLVMIYKATRHLNFALGEMGMFATFTAGWLIAIGAPYWAAFSVVVIGSFALGIALERTLVRRVDTASPLASVCVLIGLMLIFNSLAGWMFGFTVRPFPSPFPAEPLFGNPFLSSHEIGALAATGAVVLGVYWLFERTPLGLQLRAAADNPIGSRLVGIRVGWMLAIGWGLSAAIGAIAGMMIAPLVFLEPNMMTGVMLYGFAAALLGGIDSPGGAVAGGLLLGVTETLAGAYLVASELKLTVALFAIIVVLMVRPTGLFGSKPVVRV